MKIASVYAPKEQADMTMVTCEKLNDHHCHTFVQRHQDRSSPSTSAASPIPVVQNLPVASIAGGTSGTIEVGELVAGDSNVVTAKAAVATSATFSLGFLLDGLLAANLGVSHCSKVSECMPVRTEDNDLL